MKVIYIKYRDPMLFNKPTENIYEEDLDQFVPMICRDAGILLRETENNIFLGESHTEEDNQLLADWGVVLPYYRCVRVISKSQIIERKEFDLKNGGQEDE